jgi:hypothetical protein
MTEFEQSVERFLFLNSTFLPKQKIPLIKEKLLGSESAFNRVRLMTLKDPNTLLLISVFVGQLGVDRFIINKKATGALKLLFGLVAYVCMFTSFFVILYDTTKFIGWFLLSVYFVFLIVWIVDLCKIRNMTREYNYSLIMNILSL